MSANPSQPVPRPCACTTVRTASRLLARVYDEALHDAELNVTQLAVLRAIDRMVDEPLVRVAEALSMDRTSVYRAVTTMERHGWVRIIGGRDARSRSAVVSDDGRVVLDDAAPHWERIQAGIIERFGRRRWKALVNELEDLADAARTIAHDRRDRSTADG